MSHMDLYDYQLPPDLIAQHPLACRADARLMVVDRERQQIGHMHVRDLPSLLQPSDALVINDTRVIPARLVGQRTNTGGKWWGLFLSVTDTGLWEIMCKTRGRLQADETITLLDHAARPTFRLRLLANQGHGVWVAAPEVDRPYLDCLDAVGRVPLPPYIRSGEMVPDDRTSYQTVYANHPGAVAAPTAGLHFTRSLLTQIQQCGTSLHRVTLHVGPGTFRPVSGSLDEHQMHHEWCCIDDATVAGLQQVKQLGGRVIAVGTTSLRVLETAALSGSLVPWQGTTDLFIRPPFTFHAAEGLMTNFHLPKSTLLVLVRTFGGDKLLQRAYVEAIEQQYRFFSYGDAMLII